jgi:DNA polymerase-3 subunit epsilon
MQEFHRCELYPILLSETKVIDAYNLFVKKVPRTLSGALSYYCGEDHTSAHSAQGDIEATMKVLKHQLLHYNDLDPSVDFLHQYTADGETSVDFSGKFGKNNNGQVVFRFGEHRDKIVDVVVHKSYLDWMCEGDKFPIDTIMVIHRLRRHHKWQSEFKTWLDKTELLLDLEKTYILYQTLVSEKSCEPFMYSCMERRIEISCPNLPILVLESSDARHLFLVMLKNHFNEMGGLEFLSQRIEALRKSGN